MPLMLLSNGDPPPAEPMVPRLAAADSGCLSLTRGPGRDVAGFSTIESSDGQCLTRRLPLMQTTMLGSGSLFSDIEFANLDFGHMTAQEVKLKFGVGRDLPAGVHAAFDGSIGRVLGSLTPVLDEQLHATFSRPLDAHWETGLEGRLATLGTLGLMQLSERTGLLFLRARYRLFVSRGLDQRLEFKLSADSVQATTQPAARHARADLRYEYHRDSNVLSIGLNATDTEQTTAPANPSVRLDLRATRNF